MRTLQLADIFDLQDEITQKIVFALKVTLSPEEQARFRQAPTTSLDACDCFLRGMEYLHRFARGDIAQAQELFARAIELDPNYAAAYARLGLTYELEWVFQWTRDVQILERGLALAQKGLALDSTLADVHKTLSGLYLHQRRYEQAQAEVEQAVTLAPSDAEGYARFAMVLTFSGQPVEAIKRAEQALRLDPHAQGWFFFQLGFAYYTTRRYEEAIDVLQRARILSPDFLSIYRTLAAIYSELGRQAEARAAVAEMRRLNPEISIDAMRQGGLPFKDSAFLDRYLNALRQAGLK